MAKNHEAISRTPNAGYLEQEHGDARLGNSP